MKTLIICESMHHGNTLKVAKAMARTLRARVVRASEVKDASIVRNYDVVGFGSGIYHGRHHLDLIMLAEKLDGKDKKAFIFTTSGSRLWMFNMYRADLGRTLEKRGFGMIGEFSCPGWDSWGLLGRIGGLNRGRPDKSDLKRAEGFARGLVEKHGRPKRRSVT